MMKKTHIAIAVAAAIPIIKFSNIPLFSTLGVLGAVAPDWDFILGIKHRTATHSILFLIISTALIFSFNASVGFIWFISCLSHLLADSCTKMGVPFMYPFNNKYCGLKLIKTGGAEDIFICLLAIFLITLMLK